MTCRHCRRPLAEGASFCPNCGTPVSPTTESAPAAAPKKGRGCLRGCLTVMVMGMLGLVCVVAGGYLALSRGVISLSQIEGAFTPEPGTISLVNLTDETIQVQVFRRDEESGEFENSERRVDLAPFDSWESGGFRSGRPYRIDFRFQTLRSESRCTVEMANGDRYTFVALPEAIVVDREGAEVESTGDLQVDSSPHCGNTGTTAD